MQMSPAMVSACSAISRADSVGRAQERPRGRQRVGAARTDGRRVTVGLDHVAGAREHQRLVVVGHQQQRLQPAQHPVGAPILGQLDGGAGEVPAVLLEPRLELLEQRDAVGGGAGEPGHDPPSWRRRILRADDLTTVFPIVT